MAAINVKLAKKVGDALKEINPSTAADVVLYDDNLSVKDMIDILVSQIEEIENTLCTDTIYMTTDSGDIMTDDEGTGLVYISSVHGIISSTEKTSAKEADSDK